MNFLIFAMVSFLIGCVAGAEDLPPLDLEYKPVGHLGKMFTSIDDINTRNQGLPCEQKVNLAGKTEVACEGFQDIQKQAESKSTFFKLEYKNYAEVPQMFKDLLPPLPEAEWFKPVPTHIVVEIGNDNLQMLSFSALRGHPEAYGDDFGKSHWSKVTLSGKVNEAVDFDLRASSTLYTAPVKFSFYRDPNGAWFGQQKWRNEDVIELILNNQKEGKLSFWKASTGFVSLNNRKGILEAAGQQDKFHNLMNSVSEGLATHYTNAPGEASEQWKLFMGLYLGLQESMNVGNNCRLRFYTGAGGQYSTLKGMSNSYVNLGAEGAYRTGANSAVKASAEVSAKKSNFGTETAMVLSGEFVTRDHSAKLSFTKNGGQLQNYQHYNIPNTITGKKDLLWAFSYGYRFN